MNVQASRNLCSYMPAYQNKVGLWHEDIFEEHLGVAVWGIVKPYRREIGQGGCQRKVHGFTMILKSVSTMNIFQ